jgi:hypothetical protein
MSERMMLYKSLAQRRWEAVLGFGTGALLRFVFDVPPPLALLSVMAGLIAAIAINGWRLGRKGAPRMPVSEVTQHMWNEIAARPVWRLAVDWGVGFALMIGAMIAILGDGKDVFSDDGLIVIGFALAVGIFIGARRAYQARRMADDPAKPPERISLAASLRRILPRYYAGLALGTALGVAAATRFNADWRIFLVVIGMVLGSLAMPMRRGMQQLDPSGVLPLWQTLVGGILLFGVPMAILFIGMRFVDHPGFHVPDARQMLAIVSIALAGGAGFGFFMWGVAKTMTTFGVGRAMREDRSQRPISLP